MYGKGIFAKADFDALATQLRAIKGKFLLSIKRHTRNPRNLCRI